ncbi:MAG: SigF/SigG family RNA polymerase sporulation sigma factor [Clostridiales bacterium]|nr:SigF/SigG family RNA polymerase sporulation sigma factor [Clostridiales bacterium]
MEKTSDNTNLLILKAQKGDKKALERLINDNSGLIWSIVRKFNGRGAEAEDLYQLGAIGFIKCIKKFDLSFDVKLSTYAVPMIMGEIKRFLRDDGQIKVSRSLKELAVKIKYASEELRIRLGREPNIKELASLLQTEEEEIIIASEASRELESLDAEVYKNDGAPVYKLDRIAVRDDSEKIDNSIILRQAIEELNERDREIIRLRYYEDKTQSEVSKKIGVSQVQVSRLEKKILKTIREKFSSAQV